MRIAPAAKGDSGVIEAEPHPQNPPRFSVRHKVVADKTDLDTLPPLEALFHALLHLFMTVKIRVHDLDLFALEEDSQARHRGIALKQHG